MRLLSFYAGIIQFIISLFQLGKAFDWLPDYFISAFISGVSFHVITSQVFHMFGIDKKGYHDWLCVSTYQIRHFPPKYAILITQQRFQKLAHLVFFITGTNSVRIFNLPT